MKNTFGNNVSVTLFGESHGAYIGAVLDGLGAGIPVDESFIKDQLTKRRPSEKTDTPRVEADNFIIASGVFEGKTTGSPISIIIPNENTKSKDYEKTRYFPRPSHADYTAEVKYGGNQDYRGGGHFSGRITAALVAVGAVCISALKNLNIHIGTHILKCGGASDRAFENFESDIQSLESKVFPTLSDVDGKMIEKIIEAKNNLDSIGGITQTAVCGLPVGIGDPWFDSVESVISHALFGVGGIKGIEFGLGFGFADYLGSEVNDAICFDGEKVVTKTNNNGGINGGITNGMPIIFNCAVKPTPSISKEQDSIDIRTNENVKMKIEGRHDPAIIRRICPVINSVTAIALCDLVVTTYGQDVFAKGIK